MDTVTKQVLTSAVRRLDVILEKIPDFDCGVRPQLVELEGILRGVLEQKPDERGRAEIEAAMAAAIRGEPNAHYTAAALTDEIARLRKVGNDMLRALKNLLAADAAVMVVAEGAPLPLIDKRGVTVLSVKDAIAKAEEVLR